MTEEQSLTPSYLHVVPIYVAEGVRANAIAAGVQPWGAPTALALIGDQNENEGGRRILIAFEAPFSWLRPTQPIGKRELERLHVRRFATDFRLATGLDVYDAIEEGSDPPDFLARTGNSAYGLECTSLTIEERRAANALFLQLRLRLVDQQRWRLGHLSGYYIYIWFGAQQSPLTRPFRKNDDTAATELVEALVSYQPNPEQLQQAASEIPEQLPGLGSVTTPQNATFYAVPITGAVPTSPFFAATGFELGLCYTTAHTPENAWAEVQRLITDHDKPGVDVLLISVGAPDALGQAYPAEELLASLLLKDRSHSLTSRNIHRVLLHSWNTGRVLDLLDPDSTEIVPALYTGISLPNYPLIPPKR